MPLLSILFDVVAVIIVDLKVQLTLLVDLSRIAGVRLLEDSPIPLHLFHLGAPGSVLAVGVSKSALTVLAILLEVLKGWLVLAL